MDRDALLCFTVWLCVFIHFMHVGHKPGYTSQTTEKHAVPVGPKLQWRLSLSCPVALSALHLQLPFNPQSLCPSLPLSQPVPLIYSTRSPSLQTPLAWFPCREGVSTVSLTMVPVLVPPSSSCAPLTQFVLLAWCLQNRPRWNMIARKV